MDATFTGTAFIEYTCRGFFKWTPLDRRTFMLCLCGAPSESPLLSVDHSLPGFEPEVA